MFPRSYWPDNVSRSVAYTWPTVDADGPVMKPLAKLATLCSAVPVFRTRCGLDEDDAYAAQKLIDGDRGGPKSIFLPLLDFDERGFVLPSLRLYFGPSWNAEKDAGGGRNYLQFSGSLRIFFADRSRYRDDAEIDLRDFSTYVGQFFTQLTAQFGYNDELSGVAIRQVSPPQFCKPSEGAGRSEWYLTAEYLIEWK